jgi:hypothetical protein
MPMSDRELIRLARRRHWLVTTAELNGLGFSRDAIDHRLRAGRLFRVHRGVYAVGRHTLTPAGRRCAAVLACGSGALLSHTSAAAQWHLLETSRTIVDVTVPTDHRPRRGIRVHTSRTITRADITELDRIPITSVARTLVDLAGQVRRDRLEHALGRAYTLRHLDVAEIQDAMGRNANQRGVATLQGLLAGFIEPPMTRSDLEQLARRTIAAAGLPPPQSNGIAAGLCVDLLWPDWRLVVEIDSPGWHDNPWAFERDRQRDIILRKARFEVLRVTEWRLKRDPDGFIADVLALASLTHSAT